MTEVRRYEPNIKTLGEIAAFLGAEIKNVAELIEISGLCSNSHDIENGDLFSSFLSEISLESKLNSSSSFLVIHYLSTF